MNVEDFCLLYEYNSWANRRSLDACSTLSDEQFTRDIGSSFRSVRDTLSHVCEVEWLWLERWHGRSASSLRPASDFPTLESLRRRWQEVETGLIGYVDALKAEDIARVIEHKTTKGVPQAAPLWQMLQHLVNHGTYHRGQVATMLRQLGVTPNSSDLIFFYRERAAKASA
jgi:uncharacterized damage-inducible protein DinB